MILKMLAMVIEIRSNIAEMKRKTCTVSKAPWNFRKGNRLAIMAIIALETSMKVDAMVS